MAQGDRTGDDGFEEAWSQIVAELTSGPDAIAQPSPGAHGPAEPDDPQPAGGHGSGNQPSSPGGPGNGEPAHAADTAAGQRGAPTSPDTASPEPTGPDTASPDTASAGGPQPPRPTPPVGGVGEVPGATSGLARLFRHSGLPADGSPERGEPDSPALDSWSDEGHYVPPPPPDLPEGTPVSRLAWAGTLGGPATLIVAALVGYDLPRVVVAGAALAFLAGFVTLVWHMPDSRSDGWDDGAVV